jgi:hypothetical protein
MVEVLNGSKNDNRFRVPSTWNFDGYKLFEITNSEGTKRKFVELPENEKVKSYDCKCGSAFTHIGAFNIHQKSCGRTNSQSWMYAHESKQYM